MNSETTHLASTDDIVAPVVGSATVASFTNGVWRTDTLSCVSVTVIPQMTALAGCRREENACLIPSYRGQISRPVKTAVMRRFSYTAFLSTSFDIAFLSAHGILGDSKLKQNHVV